MSNETYGLAKLDATRAIAAPDLPYQPPKPRNPANLPIALVGCGGISQTHLEAYRRGGFRVVALCDRNRSKAEGRRAEYFPEADVTTDYAAVLERDDVAVIDLTPHPAGRAPLIEAAVRAGKHVLSQKPFVLDLETGRRLVALADECRVKLAVNQNGRWAPHFSYLREAIRAGLIGEVASVDATIHWDHHWILGTPFDEVSNLILYDFAIHWFDLICHFFGDRAPQSVYAAARVAPGQRAKPPFLAHAAIEFERGQATLAFNAACAHGQEDRTTVAGSLGTLRSIGPSLTKQQVTLHTAAGSASPVLAGGWFPEGFQGAMGELLCAIEGNREPLSSARQNLRSLALCLSALDSAERGTVVSCA
jgi:predicted dehydrogenase